MTGPIAILTDNTEWREACASILAGLQLDYRSVSTDVYPAHMPQDIRMVLAVLPRPDHPVVLRTEAFRSRHPGIPILAFFPPEELGHDQWMQLVNLDGVSVLPLDSVSVKDLIRLASERRDLEARHTLLTEQIDEFRSVYHLFLSAGRAMASSLQVDRVLTRIMRAAGELLHSEAWSVAIRDDETGDLVFRSAQGEAADQVIGVRVPDGTGIIGWVSRSGEPLIVPDTSQDQRHFKGLDDRSGFTSRSILCMPLKTKERSLGAIEFINKVGSQFSPQDMERVRILLDLAAVSLDNAMMFERLKAITERDELSGLYNQQALMHRLEDLILQCQQDGTTFGYIFLDLDYLKQVNDRYGHLRGRAVIQEVGYLLQSLLDPAAIIGRYGGDEFWVILRGADKPVTLSTAETIRQAIATHVFLEKEDLNIRLTASLGVVVFPQHARTFDTLTQLADEALFLAKKQNRNRVICALDTLPAEGLCLE
ncbi:sensor domain-containing diguanylate cyclase [bacterium]|nr:sensor domain-containing diguanylate cyclase [candidate division CSSED10-310 bacterium]